MKPMDPVNVGLLWVDLTQVERDDEAYSCFRERFYVKNLDRLGFSEQTMQAHANIHALVFEYDYPDRASLGLLRTTKHQYPSLPIILLTEQHSEALAIWALHARVWDYLVKPVDRHQIEQLHLGLARLVKLHDANHEHRELLERDDHLPLEMRIGEAVNESRLLQRAEAYIDAHLDARISLEEMAKLCGMSPFRFSRAFKKVHEQTFQDFLLSQRIRKASSLLVNPSVAVADVAYLVGFQDPSYFARIFKRHTGISPSDYREQYSGSSKKGRNQMELFSETRPPLS